MCHSNEKAGNTEKWHQRSRAIAATNPDHVLLNPFELAFSRNLEGFRSEG
jgi:hypothetical protein